MRPDPRTLVQQLRMRITDARRENDAAPPVAEAEKAFA
jgi:hypothetical protein